MPGEQEAISSQSSGSPYKIETIEVEGRDKKACVEVKFTKVADRPLQVIAEVSGKDISAFIVDEDIRSVRNGGIGGEDVEKDIRDVEGAIVRRIRPEIQYMLNCLSQSAIEKLQGLRQEGSALLLKMCEELARIREKFGNKRYLELHSWMMAEISRLKGSIDPRAENSVVGHALIASTPSWDEYRDDELEIDLSVNKKLLAAVVEEILEKLKPI